MKDVVLRGPAEDLEQVTEEDIRIVVDLREITNDGRKPKNLIAAVYLHTVAQRHGHTAFRLYHQVGGPARALAASVTAAEDLEQVTEEDIRIVVDLREITNDGTIQP